MLSEWERRQFAEIERELAGDVARPRRRLRRVADAFGSWNAAGVLLPLVLLLFLVALGMWTIAIALAAVYVLIALGRPARRGTPRR